jgi:hypothetical protein
MPICGTIIISPNLKILLPLGEIFPTHLVAPKKWKGTIMIGLFLTNAVQYVRLPDLEADLLF